MNPLIIDNIKKLRAKLHMCPELAGNEKQTVDTIECFLRRYTSLTVVRYDDWLLALHREYPEKPPIAFRADMDAIPVEGGGARHGCGHDGHSALLCGLALAIEGKKLGREVFLIFQGAEETGEGAQRIINHWWSKMSLPGMARIYALHNIPGFPTGSVLMRKGCFACASCGLIVRVKGRPSHAAYPDEGINPAEALSRLTLAVPELVDAARGQSDRLLMATIVGLNAGGENFGVSAAEGELCLTLRGYAQADVEKLIGAVRARAQAECGAEGLSCEFELRDEFPDTTNDDAAYDEALARFRAAGLEVIELPEPMRWSEDFGWFLKRCPGVYFGIGAGVGRPGLHTADYMFNDTIISPALKALCSLAGEDGV